MTVWIHQHPREKHAGYNTKQGEDPSTITETLRGEGDRVTGPRDQPFLRERSQDGKQRELLHAQCRLKLCNGCFLGRVQVEVDEFRVARIESGRQLVDGRWRGFGVGSC